MLALVLISAGNDATCSMSMHCAGGARNDRGCTRAHRCERLYLSGVANSPMPTFMASSDSHTLYLGSRTFTLVCILLMVKAGGHFLMSALCQTLLESES